MLLPTHPYRTSSMMTWKTLSYRLIVSSQTIYVKHTTQVLILKTLFSQLSMHPIIVSIQFATALDVRSTTYWSASQNSNSFGRPPFSACHYPLA